MRTCVTPGGTFTYGLHKPHYTVRNLRRRTRVEKLGSSEHGEPINNKRNYPSEDIEVEQADWIYEIANPFDFRGTTYIGKPWADRNAENPERISLPQRPEVSLHRYFEGQKIDPQLIDGLPRPLLLGLAVTSTDPYDLIRLARRSCRFNLDDHDRPVGLRYAADTGRPDIDDFELFEAVANNVYLPDDYKIAMVIRPGAQGASEIVGDCHEADATHIYEYLRRNSYIGGGHYAANMADDAIRYRIEDLSETDMRGMRSLYYQRSYIRLAEPLSLDLPIQPLSEDDLERLREQIINHPDYAQTDMAATLWGWNFGFDFSSTGYRLHASHQQIHQQYAMIPQAASSCADGASEQAGTYRPFSAGDLVEEVILAYRHHHRSSFFLDYLQAIENNRRLDGRSDRPRDLIVWQDEHVLLFVPKAQTSQWELQLMTRPDENGKFPGNILETATRVRRSLDHGIHKAQQALAGRGAALVTTIEYSKRFSAKLTEQPLIYCFMPKLPHSPGAFSETQLRFINGHYPEDFAQACRLGLKAQR